MEREERKSERRKENGTAAEICGREKARNSGGRVVSPHLLVNLTRATLLAYEPSVATATTAWRQKTPYRT